MQNISIETLKNILELRTGKSGVFNYALYQNGISPIRDIVIYNRGEEALEGLSLRIYADFEFFREYEAGLFPIEAGRPVQIPDPQLSVKGGELMRMTEAVITPVTVQLCRGEEIICACTKQMEVLTYDQWPGGESYRNILPAFVLPNHPAVEMLSHAASEWLRIWGKDPSLEGYQKGDPNRVRELAAAAYAAIQKKNIAYAEAPAGLFAAGQRIRTPETILGNGLGNCMDLSLLYAAVLEACGLHPLLVMMENHIFAGVWLYERTPEELKKEDLIIENRGVLAKMIGTGTDEMVFVECTAMCSGKQVSYEAAEAEAQQTLTDEEHFCYAIDVAVSRYSGIRAIPSRKLEGGRYEIVRSERDDSEITAAPTDLGIINPEISASEAGSARIKKISNKLELWESKLLDLTTRNMLLSLPKRHSVLPIISSHVDELEDALASGHEFRLKQTPDWIHDIPVDQSADLSANPSADLSADLSAGRPSGFSVNLPADQSADLFADLSAGRSVDQSVEKKDSRAAEKSGSWLDEQLRRFGYYELDCWPVHNSFDPNERIRQEYKSHSLYTFCSKKQLDRDLTMIYRAARASQQENGVSSLYMAIGLLRWYPTTSTGELRADPCYAPLILMPVEIVRKSANRGYALQARDEEPHFNMTLLEMLRRNYNTEIHGVDPLPADEFGVDIKKTFKIVRLALGFIKDWDVIESCVIGNFSFAQFVIWKDIQSGTAMLEGSKVVRSLIKGHVDWDDSDQSGQSRPAVSSPYLPITVDATQLKAIEMAAAGKSFVLHGPPGTGKSQTITAMIADLIAEGKTVLFVAEKMAALTVVQRRLAALGIGDFCLELHADKANKKHVLTQLDRALSVGRPRATSAGRFNEQAERTQRSKEKLDGYARSLHAVRNCGYSLRQLVGLYETVRDTPKFIPFHARDVGALTKETVQSHLSLIGQLTAAGAVLGNIAESPLKKVGLESYGSDVRFALRKNAETYAESLMHIQTSYYQTLNFFKGRGLWEAGRSVSLSEMYEIASMYFLKKDADEVLRFLLSQDQTLITRYYEKASANQAERQRLLSIWSPELLDRHLPEYLERHAAAEKKFFFKTSAMKAVTEEIQAYTTMRLTYAEIPAMLQVVMNYQKNRSAVEDAYFSLPSMEKKVLEKLPTEESYQKALKEAARFKKEAELFPGGLESIRSLSEDPQSDRALHAYCSTYDLLREREKAFNDLLQRDLSDAAEKKDDFSFATQNSPAGGSAAYSTFSAQYAQAGMPANTFGNPEGVEAWIGSEIALCEYVRDHTAELKNIGLYNEAKEACRKAGLGPVVQEYENGMPPEEIPGAYRKGIYYALINDAISHDDELSSFSGATFNEAIAQFKRMDEALLEQTRSEIREILVSRVPLDTDSTIIGKELNIVRKAIKSNGRSVSIRELFSRIPKVLKLLCPCMLMSPNSVARYLAQENGLFDVVIFDEASQLPTCKAAGAIARAESAVIVGDPRQMPPTTFFAGGGPEVDDVALYDLDSILDDALALGIHSHYLQWHYRSTHESLIAFSNQEFYGNKMFTFPSADDREQRVKTVHVDSLYHDGTNPGEAQAVVAEILRRFNDPELRGQTVGVVTFNIKQQTLIENLLAEEYQKNSALDIWANDGEDPLFVKNLENVQGDERDAILFSIGYGPDEKGIVSNNFGPINQTGGEKRLNVAFSRARVSMTIFSSMYFTDIRTTGNSPQGVIAFRDFLKYADTDRTSDMSDLADISDISDMADMPAMPHMPEEESGKAASAASPAASSVTASGIYPAARSADVPGSASGGNFIGASSRDGILLSISNEIRREGFRCDTMIGKSDFHVEIAVSDPNDPGRYMMGILLDGETYRQAGSTRDREIAQRDVLENLGWKLYRIWTMDWWDNREGELSRLRSALADCRAESDERAALEHAKAVKKKEEETGVSGFENPEIPAQDPNISAFQTIEGPAQDPNISAFQTIEGPAQDPDVSTLRTIEAPAQAVPAQKLDTGLFETEPIPSEAPAIVRTASGTSAFTPLPYSYAELPVSALSIAEYKSVKNQALIRERLLAVAETEAPIYKDTLFRRVLDSFGLSKTGPALDATEKAFKETKIRVTKQNGFYFCWSPGQKPGEYDGIRVGSERRADELCREEIRNAVLYVLQKKGGLGKDALIKEVSLVMGYRRLSKKLETVIAEGIQLACTEEKIVKNEEAYYVQQHTE